MDTNLITPTSVRDWQLVESWRVYEDGTTYIERRPLGTFPTLAAAIENLNSRFDSQDLDYDCSYGIEPSRYCIGDVVQSFHDVARRGTVTAVEEGNAMIAPQLCYTAAWDDGTVSRGPIFKSNVQIVTPAADAP